MQTFICIILFYPHTMTNYQPKRENYLIDAWLMIQSDENDYENIEDVLRNETTFTETDLDQHRSK